ncbi:hypothetical protein AHMF7616_02930 [Adhaeribacter pallidiroseus]|uniref:YhcG N-terminal domain-containing protein n=1 Tax=Adhaeribacter pallidiroseus TaxID=2072847 RepID=A0A369QM51_9BACT|nr:hypothetical protein AHMF7616_02930 [Adhaeribacter pallidiroseus]
MITNAYYPNRKRASAGRKEIIIQAKNLAFKNSNSILLQMYWQIGQLIVEDEQQGKAKAAYGKEVLQNLSRQLTL